MEGERRGHLVETRELDDVTGKVAGFLVDFGPQAAVHGGQQQRPQANRAAFTLHAAHTKTHSSFKERQAARHAVCGNRQTHDGRAEATASSRAEYRSFIARNSSRTVLPRSRSHLLGQGNKSERKIGHGKYAETRHSDVLEMERVGACEGSRQSGGRERRE